MKYLISLLLLFLVSCAHEVQEPKGYEQSAFWKDQKLRRTQIKRLVGQLRLNFRSRGKGASGKGQLAAQMPNQLRLEVRDVIGRMQFLAVANGSKFTAFYPSKKKTYQDATGGRSYLKGLVGVSEPFSDLFYLMLGALPPEFEKLEKFPIWEWDRYKGLYKGIIQGKRRKWHIYVDPKRSVVAEIESESTQGKFFIEYGKYFQCCGGGNVGAKSQSFLVGRAMDFRNPDSDQSIEVLWRSINKRDTPFPKRVFQFSRK